MDIFSAFRSFRSALIGDPGRLLIGTVVVSMLLTMFIYRQSMAGMVELWSLTTYQHCWLIFPVSLALLWNDRDRLQTSRMQPDMAGLAVLAVLVLLWLLAIRVGVQIIEQLSVILMIPATIWSVWGHRAVRRAAFPLLFLAAAVPIGESIIPFLMAGTADVATMLLQLSGVPVYRQGMFLSLPGGEFEVADVCSGLRYLLAGLCTAILFAYFNYASAAKRVLFIAITAVAFVVVNGFRAFIVMYVASATQMRVFAGRDHVYFGMLLFCAFIVLMILVGARFADEPQRDIPANNDAPGPRRIAAPAMIAAVILVMFTGPAVLAGAKSLVPAQHAELSMPELRDCSEPGLWKPQWTPLMVGADSERKSTYICGDMEVSLYVAKYDQQRQGKELISTQNRIWPHEQRRIAELSSVDADINGGNVTVRQVHIPGQNVSSLIWYWFDVDGLATGSEFRVKLLEIWSAVRLRPAASSLVLVAVTGRRDISELQSMAARVVAQIDPAVAP